MKIITKTQFDTAKIECGALREAIEARVNQNTFVEALFMDVDGEPDHIYVATYALEDYGHDFSMGMKFWEFAESCPGTFFVTSDVNDLFTHMQTLMVRQLTDTSI